MSKPVILLGAGGHALELLYILSGNPVHKYSIHELGQIRDLEKVQVDIRAMVFLK